MNLRRIVPPSFLACIRTAVLCTGLCIAAVLAATVGARAQSPGALPTAPGAADKAGQGGYTGARASLPGDNGSPLEPYLFLFILAGGGVVAWVLAIGTDITIRRSGVARTPARRAQ
jgi:hypothetical protein